VLAELGRLLVAEVPRAGQARDEKRPVMSVVAVLEIDGLLDGAHMSPRKAPQHLDERAVAFRIVIGPSRAAEAPLPSVTEADVGEHQMADDELARDLIIRRQRRFGRAA